MTALEKLKSQIPRGVKTTLRAIRPAFAELGRSKGAMPNLLVIGVQKAATTSLSQMLKSHPNICSAMVKEVHYFDLNYAKGDKWYRKHFGKTGACRISFESTPYYFFHPLVPQRVHAADAKMKLIVILRDPVDRAYSHYHMERHRKHEHLQKFEQAIVAEPSRISDESELLASGAIDASEAHQRYSYLARGEYQTQFQRWFQYFPRDQFLVLDNSVLLNRPEEVSKKMADFLEVENLFVAPKKKYMAGDYEPLPTDVRRRLREHFNKCNANLSKMLGMEFEWLGR